MNKKEMSIEQPSNNLGEKEKFFNLARTLEKEVIGDKTGLPKVLSIITKETPNLFEKITNSESIEIEAD